MIGRNVCVVGGQNRGLTGVIVSDNFARGQYIIKVAVGHGADAHRKISAKYHFVSFDAEPVKEIGSVIPSVGAVADCTLFVMRDKFEGKAVTVDLRTALEISNPYHGSYDGMGAWVSLVYVDDRWDEVVANVVFVGEFAVVPVSALTLYSGRPGRA